MIYIIILFALALSVYAIFVLEDIRANTRAGLIVLNDLSKFIKEEDIYARISPR